MHFEKKTRTQVPGISAELERTDEYKAHFDKTKHSIDWSKTINNYDIVQDDRSISERLNDRLKSLTCLNRADVKVLGLWVVTMPKDLDKAKQNEFFKTVYDHMCDIYGGENVLYAKIHLDETTPHMHVGIVPVSNDGLRVCAKEVFTTPHFRAFHADMQNYCEQRMDCAVNLLNGQSLGVDGIQNYKKAKDLSKEIATLDTKKINLQHDIDTAASGNVILRTSLKQVTEELTEKKGLLKKVLQTLKEHSNSLLNFLYWLQRKGLMSFHSKEENEIITRQYTTEIEEYLQRGLDSGRGR